MARRGSGNHEPQSGSSGASTPQPEAPRALAPHELTDYRRTITPVLWGNEPHEAPALGPELLRSLERELSRLRAENMALRELVRIDGLTGLANRRAFEEELRRAFAFATRQRGPVALVLFDIDGLKRLNDEHGHATGDAAICELSLALARGTRGFDLAARIGGDEFAIVLPAVRAGAALEIAERIRSDLAVRQVTSRPVSVSVGVSADDQVTKGGMAEDRLLYEADRALYVAKRAGGNRVVLYRDVVPPPSRRS